jgi:7,8-dihydroneopterin aldolase/epimerase/oxygenase
MTVQPTPPPQFAAALVRRRRHVFVRDLVVAAHIGVWEYERGKTQPLQISLEVMVDASRPHQDRLETVVCYQSLVDGIMAILAAGHVDLVETLAEQIGAMALSHADVLTASVTIEKLEAIAGARSAGVTLVLECDSAAS